MPLMKAKTKNRSTKQNSIVNSNNNNNINNNINNNKNSYNSSNKLNIHSIHNNCSNIHSTGNIRSSVSNISSNNNNASNINHHHYPPLIAAGHRNSVANTACHLATAPHSPLGDSVLKNERFSFEDMRKNVSVQVDSDFALLLPSGVYEIKKMEPRSKIRTIIVFCLFLAIAGIIGFGYFCQDQVCALSKRSMILQPDILTYNDIPAGAIGAASVQAAATGAIMVHQTAHQLPRTHQLQQQQQQLQRQHPPSALASTKALQQNNNIIIANAGLSYDDVLNDDFQFDMDGHDVMVFLHIQKTGGTSFGRHLVRDLDLKRPCECQRQRKRCYCFRPHRNENWLFSRYSTGWKCGLHADWTELTSCVDQELDKNEGESAKRRYFYISLLREPLARYMSEYRHVKRGATWKGSRHWCLGRQATQQELPPCYKGKDWLDVDIDEFAGCESNLAANRQTRMLADLALIGCYNKSAMPAHERDRVMLASAKRNLAAMAYFGLTEYQKISQYIFEETFNLRFAIPFEQHNTTLSVSAIHNLRPDQRRKIEKLNNLDIELYAFAKNLLFERFEHLKAKDNDFEKRFANLGNIYYKQGVTEFNWDSNIDETVSTEH